VGKKQQIQGDLDDVEALLEIITVLKDVSTNKFFVLGQAKESLQKFLETFLIYFNLLGSIETSCVLVKNSNPQATDIVVIASESGFMSQLNGRVITAAMREYQKFPGAQVVLVGRKIADKCKDMGMNLAYVIPMPSSADPYEIAIQLREYLVNRILDGHCGRVICVYVWAKSFQLLKTRMIRLLPVEELLSDEGSENPTKSERQKFILESKIDGIMKVLADLWVSSRLYEILQDTKLAEAAAQAQQLESSMESLSKEKKGLAMSLKSAQKGDLNKAMREVFTSTSIIKSRQRR
jgi:F0F1-type ATP synthase gamma subunit